MMDQDQGIVKNRCLTFEVRRQTPPDFHTSSSSFMSSFRSPLASIQDKTKGINADPKLQHIDAQ